MGPGAPWAQDEKAHWDQICPGRILETTGQIFIIRKPWAIPLVLDAHWLGHFPLGDQEGSKWPIRHKSCRRIRGWFWRLLEAIWWHSTLDLFLPLLLTYYVDSSTQWSLLGRQSFCLPSTDFKLIVSNTYIQNDIQIDSVLFPRAGIRQGAGLAQFCHSPAESDPRTASPGGFLPTGEVQAGNWPAQQTSGTG